MTEIVRNELGQIVTNESEYTPEIADRICAELASGKSIRRICKLDWAPGRRTVYDWLRTHQDFRELYAIAQLDGAHAWADEAIEIADDGTNDWIVDNDPENPGYRLNGEHVQRSRLRVDTRKWYAARMNPKKYGDKVDLTHANPDGTPIRLLING